MFQYHSEACHPGRSGVRNFVQRLFHLSLANGTQGILPPNEPRQLSFDALAYPRWLETIFFWPSTRVQACTPLLSRISEIADEPSDPPHDMSCTCEKAPRLRAAALLGLQNSVGSGSALPCPPPDFSPPLLFGLARPSAVCLAYIQAFPARGLEASPRTEIGFRRAELTGQFRRVRRAAFYDRTTKLAAFVAGFHSGFHELFLEGIWSRSRRSTGCRHAHKFNLFAAPTQTT